MELREVETASIRLFVRSAATEGHFKGRVLDYGCGMSPHRDIVEEAGATYVGYDRADLPANVSGADVGDEQIRLMAFDAALTTQTIQYWLDVEEELSFLRTRINDGGALVITGPTNWPWVEAEDRRRYTPTEIERLLYAARFKTVKVVERDSFRCGGLSWLLGWGAIAIA